MLVQRRLPVLALAVLALLLDVDGPNHVVVGVELPGRRDFFDRLWL